MTKQEAIGMGNVLFPLVSLNNSRGHVNMSFGKYYLEITAFYDKYDTKANDDAEYYGILCKGYAKISVNTREEWDFTTLKIEIEIDL